MPTPTETLDTLLAALDEDDLSDIRRGVLYVMSPDLGLDEEQRNEGTREVIAERLRRHLHRVE